MVEGGGKKEERATSSAHRSAVDLLRTKSDTPHDKTSSTVRLFSASSSDTGTSSRSLPTIRRQKKKTVKTQEEVAEQQKLTWDWYKAADLGLNPDDTETIESMIGDDGPTDEEMVVSVTRGGGWGDAMAGPEHADECESCKRLTHRVNHLEDMLRDLEARVDSL